MLYLLTLDEVKDMLGIKDPEDDARVTSLLEGLQGRFENACRRSLCYAAGVVELFDGGVQWLLLKAFPIEVVTSVHVSSEQVWDETSLLAQTEYRVNSVRGRLVYGSGSSGSHWPVGFGNVRVVYSGGLVTNNGTPAPGADAAEVEALKGVARIQANFEWRNRQNLGQQSVSAQGVSVNLAPAKLLPEVQAVLQRMARV